MKMNMDCRRFQVLVLVLLQVILSAAREEPPVASSMSPEFISAAASFSSNYPCSSTTWNSFVAKCSSITWNPATAQCSSVTWHSVFAKSSSVTCNSVVAKSSSTFQTKTPVLSSPKAPSFFKHPFSPETLVLSSQAPPFFRNPSSPKTPASPGNQSAACAMRLE